MIGQNEVKLTIMSRSFAKLNGQNIPAYEIHFTIHGQGDYVAYAPIQGFTAAKGMEAVAAVAAPVIEFMNQYPK